MNTKYLFFGLALAAMTSLSACDDDEVTREVSPAFTGTNEVYFPKSKESREFDPADGISTYKVTVARRDSVGDVVVPIQVLKNDSSIFVVPESVKFEDKSKTAEVVVSFPGGKEGITYSLELTVDASDINPYFDQVPTYSFSFVNLAWKDAELPAVWEDGIIMGAFGVDYVPFYVKYQYVNLSDGSAKYRFLNPFASMPTEDADRYGVYNGYPYNEEGDYDEEGTYNLVVNVTAKGVASMVRGSLGVDWGYGMFETGSSLDYLSSATPENNPYGELADGAITFPDGSLFIYLPTNGAYLAKKTTIYIDTKKYQDEHSVVHIADLENGFNNEDIEWNLIGGAKFTEFVSEAFDKSWEKQAIVAATDMDENAGENSEFLNLYALPDLYKEGYNFAFYLDTLKKNSITIPTQPTGLTFAGKKILVRDAGGSKMDSAEVYTIPCLQYTFNIEFITEDGSTIGTYTEVYNWSTEEKPAPEITEDFFLGDFTMAGYTPFNNADDVDDMPIKLVKGEDGKIHIQGVDFCDDIVAEFDAESKTLSIAPQQLGNFVHPQVGEFDVYLSTFDEEFNVFDEETPLILEADPYTGVISISETSVTIGYILSSEAIGGYIDGYYDLVLTPSEGEEAPKARQTVLNLKKLSAARRNAEKVSTANLKIQGKATRYSVKSFASVMAF